MRILPTPDIYSLPGKQYRLRYIGQKWITDLSRQMQSQNFQNLQELTIDISQIDFITLFEWTTVVSYLESLLKKERPPTAIIIDAKGENDLQMIPSHDFIQHMRGASIPFTPNEIKEAERVYRVLGFIESLGGYSVLRHPYSRLGYLWMEPGAAALQAFYSRESDDPYGPTVLFPMSRIESKEQCRAFVMDHPFGSWREAMGEKFRGASVFWSEEFWRVICYELSANIWEHAGATGFLSARVVEPCVNKKKSFLHRWQLTYGTLLNDKQKQWMKDGLLEIVVTDCGTGIVKTLEEKYREIHSIDSTIPVDAQKVLCFAFDELGTSKKRDNSWVTARHALSRILRIVGKYGGSLRIRSGGCEVIYMGKGASSFTRLRNQKGIVPTRNQNYDFFLDGTQLQVLLPLYFPDADSEKITRRSVLQVPLPPTYHIQLEHPIGHLVPLLEEIKQAHPWVGEDEARAFRAACERLCERLLGRPRDEAIVLDFSYLKWTTEQFETLLHLLQNVLQHRPTLLVEIDPRLVLQIVALEEMIADTQINSVFVDKSPGFAGKTIGELGISSFLETYRGVHAILLGLDRDGRKTIFGLPSRSYEKALLELIYEPQKVDGLCQAHGITGIDKNQVTALLNGPNPIFMKAEDGRWSCLWNEFMLAAQQRRSLARHFDKVAENCGAWRGKKKEPPNIPPPAWNEDSVFDPFFEFPETEYDTGEELFYLPWTQEWRKEFLECARILSRERYADEIARRLIFRLDRLLQNSGRFLGDVKTIACVTAPSMLLTEAIHRCWPIEYAAPTVADLGYYILLGAEIKIPPRLLGAGGIVVIQDIMDKQNVSEKLFMFIQKQTQIAREHNQAAKTEILAQIGFVRLRQGLTETCVTGTDENWKTHLKTGEEVLCHCMIEVPRPASVPQPDVSKEDSELFWIEPRSLRPFRYSRLRSETPDSDPNQKRRKICLQSFDDPNIGPLIVAGHYVYGDKHYSVAVDIPQLARSEIGRQIATGLASICMGDEGRDPAPWERIEGRTLTGAVTGVLMPLHSQIHHLWPRVTMMLAQSGRRQPAWYLDATLLYGSGPSYRIPQQLVYQIRSAAMRLKHAPGDDNSKIRLLVLDDAMISGRTGETIIANLMRVISTITQKGKYPSPVEWIRYFSILNQCTYARNEVYQNMSILGGNLGIKILFEDFAPFMGVKTYDSDNCPSCKTYERLLSLRRVAETRCAHDATHWIDKTLSGLYPCAIDGHDFHHEARQPLPKPLNVILPLKTDSSVHAPRYADTAIWQLQELMYLNQPPSLVLAALSEAFPETGQEESASEYERYRWAVIGWCIRNWTLLEFDRAESIFFKCIHEEVIRNTPLVPSILDSLSTLRENEDVRKFIGWCAERLAELERDKAVACSDYVRRALDLDIALTLFFLNVPHEELTDEENSERSYISILDKALAKIGDDKLSLLRNLRVRLGRNPRFPRSDWALSVVGESLFRGQTRSKPIHPVLLPRALDDVVANPTNPPKRRILEGSLAAFLAAVEDLTAYGPLLCLSFWIDKGKPIMEWLRLTPDNPLAGDLPRGYDIFRESLDPDREWCLEFNNAFHPTLRDLTQKLEQRKTTINDDLRRSSRNREVELICSVAPDVEQCRILTHVDHFSECIVNIALNPIYQCIHEEKMTTAINIFKSSSRSKEERGTLCLTINTQFRDFRSTSESIKAGPHVAADLKFLEPYGVKMLDPHEPEAAEKQKGYTTAIDFLVPLGFSHVI